MEYNVGIDLAIGTIPAAALQIANCGHRARNTYPWNVPRAH